MTGRSFHGRAIKKKTVKIRKKERGFQKKRRSVCLSLLLILIFLLSACETGANQPAPFPEKQSSPVSDVPGEHTDTTDTETEARNTSEVSDIPPETDTVPQDSCGETETEASVLPTTSSMIFDFVGDVMLASENGYDGFWSFNQFAYETDPAYYFAGMQELFASDDYTVANCENVFTDRPLEPAPKEGERAYWYRSGTENAVIYSAGSIEIVSLANNHALDYGMEGRNDTADALRAEGMTVLTEQRSTILEKDGVRVGLLCVSMYSEYYLTPILEWLAEVSETTDFQIVYYHGGTERVHEPEAWRIRASHALVDAGADLVLGNHPHVLQPVETYRGVPIIYSLGNFLFGGAHTCENRTMVYRLTLDLTDGKITGSHGTCIPCYCYGELWQPIPIPKNDKAYEPVMAFLRGEAELPYVK